MGNVCIFGLFGIFFDKLEGHYFFSYIFYLELALPKVDPSFLLSSLIYDSFVFLFFSYYLRRIYVFLAPSASALMIIHS